IKLGRDYGSGLRHDVCSNFSDDIEPRDYSLFCSGGRSLIGALAPLAGCRGSPILSLSKQSSRALGSVRPHGSEIASTCQPWTRAVQSGTATSPAHASVIAARITIPAEMATGCRLWRLVCRDRMQPPLRFDQWAQDRQRQAFVARFGHVVELGGKPELFRN